MLRIESLSITLGEFSVRDVSLEIHAGEYVIILGPTGAGKTVLLETIAGIHTPDSGRILLGDNEITATEPRLRNIGMVYQDYMLFPHLTVGDNIAFGLHQRKISPDELHALVGKMSSLLEISHLQYFSKFTSVNFGKSSILSTSDQPNGRRTETNETNLSFFRIPSQTNSRKKSKRNKSSATVLGPR